MPVQKVSEGKYRIWVSAGRGADGKRLRYSKTVYVKDEKAAEKQLKSFEKEVLKDELPLPRNMSFKQLWELYLKDHVELNDSQKTKEWYKNLSFRILPALGHMQASAIQPLNISNFYTALKNPDSKFGNYSGGVSAASLKHYHRALKAVFNFGVSYKIVKSNPMQSIKAPKTPKSIPDAFDDENIDVLFEALAKEPLKWQTLCMLAVSSGMRREEIAGLKWSDINFNKKTVSIQRAIIYIPKKPLIVDTTKTETSIRTIAVSDISLALLLNWKESARKAMMRRLKRLLSAQVIDTDTLKYCDSLRNRIQNFDNEYIWNQYDGSPLNPDSITSYWRKLRKKYKLPDVTFKGLRHTSATLAIANGADVRNLAKRFGHSDPTMILRVYAESIQSADKRIANTWDNIISEKSKWHKDGTFRANKENANK